MSLETILLNHCVHGEWGPIPWVILHGLLGRARNWASMASAMAQTPLQGGLTVDLRNHGASGHISPHTYPAMVADVCRLLNEKKLSKVHLIGHSMGGKAAMLLACRYPERVARLTVVDIAPKAYEEIHYGREFQAMRHLNLGMIETRAQADAALQPFIADPQQRAFLLTNLARDAQGQFFWQADLQALEIALPHLASHPLNLQDQYHGPTTFICGAQSTFVHPQDTTGIQHHFPAARIEWIPQAGHNPHIDTPAAFLGLLIS